MKLPVRDALILVCAMGGVIFFCRAFPFLFFPSHKTRSKAAELFLDFVARLAPPAAMTVLALNALGASFRENPKSGLMALIASVFTVLVHVWKRNPLISIFGGTAVYMILSRVIVL